jgi:two-component system chemotaxis sensor kinase CheA
MIEDEALWSEFAAESEEHLDAIERALGAGTADRPVVDRLFRAFHSLKGMSDALGAPGMKNVAHRAEDILGLARQGRVEVAGEVADALLAAVDVLRRQRGTVLETHRDAPAPAELLARLGALADGGPPRAAPRPAAAAAPHRWVRRCSARSPPARRRRSRCSPPSPRGAVPRRCGGRGARGRRAPARPAAARGGVRGALGGGGHAGCPAGARPAAAAARAAGGRGRRAAGAPAGPPAPRRPRSARASPRWPCWRRH